MERLLKKSESKSIKISQKLKGQRKSIPHIIYTNRIGSVTISMPADISFPLNSTPRFVASVLFHSLCLQIEFIIINFTCFCRKPKTPVLCGVENCKQLKKYACSKTGTPLCSYECYKKNLKQTVTAR